MINGYWMLPTNPGRFSQMSVSDWVSRMRNMLNDGVSDLTL